MSTIMYTVQGLTVSVLATIDNFLIHQDAREGQDAVEESGDAKLPSIAGDGPEVEPAVAQGGTFAADRGNL